MNTGAKKILVVDDEISIRRFLRVSLESNQMEVFEAENAQAAQQELISRRPDLVILDLGLPDMSGLDVLKNIRGWSKVPVIVLTVQDSDEDKVQALDAGADDYLTKPFSVPELLARIRVALRHSQSPEEKPIFHSGFFEMDYAGHIVKVAGNIIKLTSTEFDILKVLTHHAGKVVTHRMLLKEVWGPNAVEHTQYLRVYLGQIRKKIQLDPNFPDLILTEPGVGYRFSLIEPTTT